MSVIKHLKDCTVMLNDLSKAVANARSEVEKLLTVLEAPALIDVQQKYEDRPYDVDPVISADSHIPRFKAPEEINSVYQGT